MTDCVHNDKSKYVDCATELLAARKEVMRLRTENAELLKTPFWTPGYPPKPYCNEWFIAKTIWDDRVVLQALPEEYAYDFKTADDTHIKKEKIAMWMQFPDSEFKVFVRPQPANDQSALHAEDVKEQSTT